MLRSTLKIYGKYHDIHSIFGPKHDVVIWKVLYGFSIWRSGKFGQKSEQKFSKCKGSVSLENANTLETYVVNIDENKIKTMSHFVIKCLDHECSTPYLEQTSKEVLKICKITFWNHLVQQRLPEGDNKIKGISIIQFV